jgi:putative OPT family oligopeptide transporter
MRERELTLKGILVGTAITIVFMAANIYLGLKTGMTFSTSIPAAVISMGVLKLTGSGNILENNIVQTLASSAGTLCNVILVLPGLLLLHYWTSLSLWQTSALCLLGGLFGVAYSVPLRRVMVVESDLPFPEGRAAADVLAAAHSQNGHGIRDLLLSALAAGALSVLTNGLKLLPDHLGLLLIRGSAVFRFSGTLSLALIGVGYLVRIGACLALLLGLCLAWGIAVPVVTYLSGPQTNPAAAADAIWSDKVRLIGAGIIAVGGLWTVISLVRPIVQSIRYAFHQGRSKKGRLPREDRDIPMSLIGLAVLILCFPTGFLFASFVDPTKLPISLWVLIPTMTLATAAFGFMMAAACGYMAGLLGSSSSPISGIGILSTMIVAEAFTLLLSQATSIDQGRLLAAVTLFMSSMVVTIASIANDNLQDLKTGHIVKATPWCQQIALILGVIVGAATVGPVLRLLYEAYGFPGAFPRAGMDPKNALPAPQAALMTQIAAGIVRHSLPWLFVIIGAVLGGVLVALEGLLRRVHFSLPALTVGIGMYLPMEVVVTIALGGILSWLTEYRLRGSQGPAADKVQENARRRGVLMASGFLVGESIIGILIASCDVLSGRSGALTLSIIGHSPLLSGLGLLTFAAALVLFYTLITRSCEPHPA